MKASLLNLQNSVNLLKALPQPGRRNGCWESKAGAGLAHLPFHWEFPLQHGRQQAHPSPVPWALPRSSHERTNSHFCSKSLLHSIPQSTGNRVCYMGAPCGFVTVDKFRGYFILSPLLFQCSVGSCALTVAEEGFSRLAIPGTPLPYCSPGDGQ